MRRRLIMILRLLTTCLILQGSCLLADDWIYTVRPGDNLWNLAEQHLTSFKYVKQLQQLNGVQNPYHLPPGKKIRIPLAWTTRQSASARIVSLHGKVIVKRGNSQKILQAAPDLQLFVGDAILSEVDSFVTIEFSDGSRLRLQENSSIRLNDLKIFGNVGLIKTAVELNYGRVESVVPENPRSNSRFSIKTPSAISSVRGTEFRVGVLQDNATASEVLTGALKVSGEKQAVNVDKGYGSVTLRGMPPLLPVRLLPAPDLSTTPALLERLPLIIPVGAIAGAQAYRAQIAKDSEFQHMLTEFVTTTLPFREGDLPDGNYWLRVRAIDKSGLEGYDAIKAVTINARPEPPFVITPQPDTILLGERPVLKWAAHSAASRYLVEISRESNFLPPLLFSDEVAETSLQLQNDLTPGNYFWRIASVVAAEEGTGPFSDSMKFRVPVPGPSLEKLEVDKSSITFSWRIATEGQKFHVQLARDKEFSQILLDQETADAFITLPRPQGGKYFLRTRTIETDGFEGPYGAAQSIDIPHATPYWLIILLLPLLVLL